MRKSLSLVFAMILLLTVSCAPAALATEIDYTEPWNCIAYEVSGVSYDADMYFPDGITMTLNADGTGLVQLTPTYAHPITWSAAGDGITVNGGYMLYDPIWDPDTSTLSLCYVNENARIVFLKPGAVIAEVLPTEAPPTEAPPTEAPPTEVPPAIGSLPQVYTCDYFSIAFPDSWVQDVYDTYNWNEYFSAQYNLLDENGWTMSSVQLSVSVEKVANYRAKLDTLLEYASEEGKPALDEITVGGLTFQGTAYDEYWPYAEYTARVPEASVTIYIEISDPDSIEDVLSDILASITFTYPIPDVPNVDPPLPEDGVRYQPSTTAVTIDSYDLEATWLSTADSMIPKNDYSNSIAALGDTVYVLSGKKLGVYTRSGDTLSASDTVLLGDEYRVLSTTWDDIVYITNGFDDALAYQNGTAAPIAFDAYLAMHPDGTWGLSYWSSQTVQKITFTPDGIVAEDWVLTDLSEDTRQGRFNSIDTIAISADHVFVAGTDAGTDYITRIAMYDLEGNELAVFGAADWMEDSYIASVAGMVETNNGIMVLDGTYSRIMLFSMDGTFIGYADCDDLLGTAYPWPVALCASDNGALVLLTQERSDESAVELLVFEITGF